VDPDSALSTDREHTGARPAAAPVAPLERIEAIDAVRGVALFGVLIVNLVTEFRVSIFQQLLGPTSGGGADLMVERVVALGFQSKAFCLFALLFGVGLAIQFERLSAAGRPLYWLARRLGVLLAFGLIHLLFIWNGDILTEYALAGFVVLPLLLLPARALLLAALAFLAAYAGAPALYSISWPGAAELRAHVASANQVYSSGTLAEIWRFSVGELPWLLKLHLSVFLRTLALFVLGMFLWKAGILKRYRDFRSEILIAAIMGIALGAVLTAGEAHDALDGLGTAALALADLAPVLLALGYGAALLALAELSSTRRFLSVFAPLGRMAFTNYVLQSVVLGFIFFGYGLGQFGRMGAAAAFALGVALYAAQLVFSRWWLRRYRFGPLEWLWRTLMYGAARPPESGINGQRPARRRY
jgi:uncharacterized protein